MLCNRYVLYLQKHLQSHMDITKERIRRELKSLKRQKGIIQLADLRASNPDPPMVSQLDSEQEDPEEGPGGCQKRSCVNAHQQIMELEREVQELRQDNQMLRVSK